MNITEVFGAKPIAMHWNEVASAQIPYLGASLFPNAKKAGLDLKWIKGHKGLAVSLAPSNFDAKSVLRGREGFKVDETEMAFFRESMLVKEADEQEIMRVESMNDPYAAAVVARLFDDAATLISGAEVVAERMRMQLLCPVNAGSPQIVISANGVQYSYNYDQDGAYAQNNYMELVSNSDKWTDHTNSDPMADITQAMEAVEANTGARPTRILMNQVTFNHIKANEKVRAAILAQNVTANVFMNTARVKELFQTELGLTVLIYTKQFKDEAGQIQKFYADGFCTLLPEGTLGNTWRGVTPEERTLNGNPIANVSVLNDGIAVAVTVTEDPVNTKTTVSEIVLPSFERMDETYVIKAF